MDVHSACKLIKNFKVFNFLWILKDMSASLNENEHFISQIIKIVPWIRIEENHQYYESPIKEIFSCTKDPANSFLTLHTLT